MSDMKKGMKKYTFNVFLLLLSFLILLIAKKKKKRLSCYAI